MGCKRAFAFSFVAARSPCGGNAEGANLAHPEALQAAPFRTDEDRPAGAN